MKLTGIPTLKPRKTIFPSFWDLLNTALIIILGIFSLFGASMTLNWLVLIIGIPLVLAYFVSVVWPNMIGDGIKKEKEESESDWMRYLIILCREVKKNPQVRANMFSVGGSKGYIDYQMSEIGKGETPRAKDDPMEKIIKELNEMGRDEKEALEEIIDIVEILNKRGYAKPTEPDNKKWKDCPEIFITSRGKKS